MFSFVNCLFCVVSCVPNYNEHGVFFSLHCFLPINYFQNSLQVKAQPKKTVQPKKAAQPAKEESSDDSSDDSSSDDVCFFYLFFASGFCLLLLLRSLWFTFYFSNPGACEKTCCSSK